MQIKRAIGAWVALVLVALPSLAAGQSPDSTTRDSIPCPSCEEWNTPHAPFRLFGNSWYVGTHGLSSILITSPQGHVLIDGALPQSAAQVAASIHSLGFRVEDVKMILNSHVHWDHAGGIGELARLSGAEIAASASSAAVFRTGNVGRDDPQFGIIPAIATVRRIRVVTDGEAIHVGPIAITPHFTPGHTPGGTSWTWESCESGTCRAMVYGDSQSAISADGFLFTQSSSYPHAITDFERGFAFFDQVKCDILVTPHPSASQLWERLSKRDAGTGDALVDPTACRRYASGARERLAKRIAEERARR